MTSTILVIDSNAAVQAITALALSETGCAIEQLTEGAHAMERITKLRPVVVLIAKELTGVDPMQMPERMRSASPETRYVLLAPADGSTALEARATQAGFSEVLFKPFKSNRLREVVSRLLTPTVEAVESPSNRPRVHLDLTDKFLVSLFQRLLSRVDADVFFEQSADLDQATALTVRQFVVGATPTGVGLGEQLVICSEAEREAAHQAYPQAQLLTIPFGMRELTKAVAGVLTFTAPPTAVVSPLIEASAPAATAEQAALAAKISAAIFEQLLLQPALRERDWERAASLASAETLRVAAEPGKL